jgi:hypothetical protein
MSIISSGLFINKMIRMGADKSAVGAINRPLRLVGAYRAHPQYGPDKLGGGGQAHPALDGVLLY